MARQRLTLLQQQRAKLKKQRALAKTSKQRNLLNQRIQRVNVQIESVQRQLPGSSPKGLLKPGQAQITGRSDRPALPPGRTTPTGRPSARRATAAAKQTRAAQGTRSTTVRTGQPAGSANQRYGANVVDRAVKRAQSTSRLRGLGKASLPVAAQSVGLNLAGKLAQTVGKKDMPRMSRLGIQGPTKGVTPKQSGLSKAEQERLRQKAAIDRRRKQGEMPDIRGGSGTGSTKLSRARIRPTTAETKPADRVPAKTPSTTATKAPAPKESDKPVSTKPKSTLQKEIEGTRKFIATHKDKKGAMQNAVKQARARLERLIKKDPATRSHTSIYTA